MGGLSASTPFNLARAGEALPSLRSGGDSAYEADAGRTLDFHVPKPGRPDDSLLLHGAAYTPRPAPHLLTAKPG